MDKVRKAVIPAAGLGTRFLPVTKAIPKELLPVGERPQIEWAVREAVAAGITDVILILSPNKLPISRHFQPNLELSRILRERARDDLADEIDRGFGATITTLIQDRPLGLGHAVLQAKRVVPEGESFAVLLPDELYLGDRLPTQELIEARAEGGSIIAIEKVPPAEVFRYGIADIEFFHDSFCGIVHDVVEKPSPEAAPSQWCLPGRYVFSWDFFRHLEALSPDTKGEIQLTDALHTLAPSGRLWGMKPTAHRFDAGNPDGLLLASIAFALERPGSEALRNSIRRMVGWLTELK